MRRLQGVIVAAQQGVVTIRLTTGHIVNTLIDHMFTYGDTVEVLLRKDEAVCVYPLDSVDVDDLPEEPEEELFDDEFFSL